MKNKALLFGVSLFSIAALTACSPKPKPLDFDNSKSNSTEVSKDDSKSSSEDKLKLQATNDAKIALDFMFKGNKSGVSSISSQSGDDIQKYLEGELAEKQISKMKANGNLDDYFLIVDNSPYYSREIIDNYATAYYKQAQTIKDYEITNVDVTESNATVTVKFKPIAALSEANPIGTARTEIFGSMEAEEIVRQSKNKDVDTLKSLLTLFLYGVYYGDMGGVAEKLPEEVETTFVLDRKGDTFMANNDVFYELLKSSRADGYADSKEESSIDDKI